MSKRPFLPSAAVQTDMAIIQGGIAYQVAHEHASQGADPGAATKHGANVGGITLAWWLFVLGPAILFTLFCPFFLSALYWVWALGLDLGAWYLHRVLKDWRHRPIGSPSHRALSGGTLWALWCCWFWFIWFWGALT